MDGVMNLTRTPQKENGTSRVSDMSLLEESRAAAVRRITQRFRPSKALRRAQIDRIR